MNSERSGCHPEGLRGEAGDGNLPLLKPRCLFRKEELNDCVSPHHKLRATLITNTEPGLTLDAELIFIMNSGQATAVINTGLALNETLSCTTT